MMRFKPQDIVQFMGNKSDLIKHCSAWYKTCTGQAALNKVQVHCADKMSEIFGYYGIQIGSLSSICNLLTESRVNAVFTMTEPDSDLVLSERSSLIASNTQLPILTDNIDLVVGTHILEMSDNPHQVLREIDRVLVPEGHCILVGFNPFCLTNSFGIKNIIKDLFTKKSKRQNFKIRSVARVRDWFSVLGFEVVEVSYMSADDSYEKGSSRYIKYAHAIKNQFSPVLSGIYIIHAKKQVISMRPNKKVWMAPALLKGGKVAINRTAKEVRRNNYSN